MASEDSDQVTSGCPSVHRLGDRYDFKEALDIEMSIGLDDSHTQREPFKVTLLRRTERMSLEERDYRLQQLLPPVHDELAQVLAMVVVALRNVDATAAKEALQLL
jgi:hypothetical protein